MPIKFALLIDGGFVKHKLGSKIAPISGAIIQEFVEKICQLPELKAGRLHRVYFYDAKPSDETVKKPLGGELMEFAKTPAYAKNTKLFAELVKLPFMALRMGEVIMNGWQIKARTVKDASGTELTVTANDFAPMIAQKGVDMRIGLDIASLTLKKQVDVIVLVTGDSDFVPAMKFARKEGAQLYLVPLGHGVKEAMYEHADLILQLEPAAVTPIN